MMSEQAVEPAATCMVIQVSGEKADRETGRVLDIDASYPVIRSAVEGIGLPEVELDLIVLLEV